MIRDLVDLQRYPIADLSASAAQSLLDHARQELVRENILLLDGFVPPDAVAGMAREVLAALPNAYRRDRTIRGIGMYKGERPAPSDHAINVPNRSCQSILAADQIPSEGTLWSLYQWQPLTDFIAAVVGVERLYRSADPLASLTATAIGNGDLHGWHFDENDFVVSLLLQESVAGGQFEVLPNAKTDAGVDFDLCASALAETASGVVRPPLRAGTLSLFCGRRALHRVSPVAGDRQRLIALFSYDRRPGMMFSSDVHMGAFGRTLDAPAINTVNR
jgi:hypothetical protein